MKNIKNINIYIIAILFVGLCSSSTYVSGQEQFLIIANKQVPQETINKSTVKRIFNGFTTQWKNNSKIKPSYIQIPNDSFWKFIGTTDSNFQKFWTKRTFSGNGVSPIEHKSNADVINYVNKIPGAIGIIEVKGKDSLGSNCKVLELVD